VARRHLLQAAIILGGAVVLSEPARVALFECGSQPFGAASALLALANATIAYSLVLGLAVFAVSRIPSSWAASLQLLSTFLVALAVLLVSGFAVFIPYLPLATLCSTTSLCRPPSTFDELLRAHSVVASNGGYAEAILVAAVVLLTAPLIRMSRSSANANPSPP
jgi:hypothetical protein